MSFIPRTRAGALVRFALGAFVVIAFSATTAAVAVPAGVGDGAVIDGFEGQAASAVTSAM